MGITLNSRFIRFAVRSEEENETIIQCLNDIV